MAGILRYALVLLIADSSVVNFRVFASAISTVAKSFETFKVVPDIASKAPDAVATVEYANGVYVNEGNVLTPTIVKDPPSVNWDAQPNNFYTLIMTDPDVSSGAKVHQWHHWLVANVPGADVTRGDVLYDYIGSGPPPDSGLHRYVFLVFKQPSKLKFNDPILMNESLVNREKFSVEEFTKKYNLGDPVAGNFFQAEYDDYVPELYKQLKEKYNL